MTFSKEEKYTESENGGFGGALLKNTKNYLFGLLFGLCGLLLTLVLFSALMTLNAVPDGFASIFSYVSVAVACLIAGFVAVRLIGTGGLLNGVVTGAVFFLIHLIVFFILGGSFSIGLLIYLAVELGCACLGGVAAVNTK